MPSWAQQAFEGVTPPLPISALATGGTARTLRRMTGRRLGEKNLTEALQAFTAKPARSWPPSTASRASARGSSCRGNPPQKPTGASE